MTFKQLGANITREKEIIQEIKSFFYNLEKMKSFKERNNDNENLLEKSMISLIEQLKIINNSIPSLLDNMGGEVQAKNKNGAGIVEIKYPTLENKKTSVFIKEKSKKDFIESAVKSTSKKEEELMKRDPSEKPVEEKSNYYVILSNRFFKQISEDLVKKGYFLSLNSDLRKITSPYILRSYISMIFLTTVLAFILGIIFFVPTFFILSLGAAISVLVLMPILAFFLMYNYPSSHRRALEKNIDQELPFVVIYLSAISTSGIEPSKIFDVLEKTKDYPTTRREIKKLLNYINFYGFDLVGALKLCSKTCPSEELSQLFNGLASTINSGGELTEFLSKRSETLLFNYKLEREKYTRTAETLMNIYISVVIAAPMILMMVMILISMTSTAGALTPVSLTILTIAFVGITNLVFLIILNSKQPKF